MSAVTTQSASNLIVPGAYVDNQQPTQAVAPLVNTALNAFVGGGNWGPVDTPVRTSDATSIFAAFGNDTTSAFSLVEEMLNALPEDGAGIGVRASDGTDVAATISLVDAAAAVVLTLTAIFTGSLPNGNSALAVAPAGARIDLVSGTPTASPVLRVTIFFPNALPEVFNNIIAYAAVGGAYDAPSFKANALAAINGTAQNSVASQRWLASAGASTVMPVTAAVTNASGGTDGTSGLTASSLVGTDGTARTGMYALRQTGFFHLALCGLTDLSFAPTLSAFVASESAALGFITVPKGTTDSAAYGLRLTNGALDDNLVLVKDFTQTYDQVAKAFRYVSPLGKAMGIVGLCPPEVSPINAPWNISGASAGGVVATEQSVIGPRSQDELAALITNGFVSITNQMPLNNGAFGFFNDVCSSGDPRANNGAGNYIPVVRLGAYLAQAFVQLGAPFVGKGQSTAADDPLRAAVEASYNNFLSQLAPNGGPQRIDSYSVTCDLTNNTPATIAQGYCFVMVLVRYLGIVRIFYVTMQGGTSVQVSNNPPLLAA